MREYGTAATLFRTTDSSGSMGGLLAADTLLEFFRSRPDEGAPLWPRLIACIAFDTPVSVSPLLNCRHEPKHRSSILDYTPMSSRTAPLRQRNTPTRRRPSQAVSSAQSRARRPRRPARRLLPSSGSLSQLLLLQILDQLSVGPSGLLQRMQSVVRFWQERRRAARTTNARTLARVTYGPRTT